MSDRASKGALKPVKGKVMLRLYVAGAAPNSAAAVAHLRALVPAGKVDEAEVSVEVVNILVDSARAFADGIIVSPTLVRLRPLPVLRIVGDLRDHEAVRLALGIQP